MLLTICQLGNYPSKNLGVKIENESEDTARMPTKATLPTKAMLPIEATLPTRGNAADTKRTTTGGSSIGLARRRDPTYGIHPPVMISRKSERGEK